MLTRSMLAAAVEDIYKLRYPLFCTPKIDGIRCLNVGGRALSRSFKEIPNNYIRTRISAETPHGCDGELVLPGMSFQSTTSMVMSFNHDLEHSFRYLVFDYIGDDLGEGYAIRIEKLKQLSLPNFCQKVIPDLITSAEKLEEFEEHCLNLGFEGVCMRSPYSPYKCGRSTLKQQWLLKLKRFLDTEVTIVGYEPLMTNTNPKEKNELGLSKRSSSQEGLVEQALLGAFRVSHPKFGNFSVGSGFTAQQRKELWETRDTLIGKIITIKYMPCGMLNVPRHPIFKGFRSEEDIS